MRFSVGLVQRGHDWRAVCRDHLWRQGLASMPDIVDDQDAFPVVTISGGSSRTMGESSGVPSGSYARHGQCEDDFAEDGLEDLGHESSGHHTAICQDEYGESMFE